VLPILHLNGYKIANPCVLARISHEELDQLFRGYGYTPIFVEGSDPMKMHQLHGGGARSGRSAKFSAFKKPRARARTAASSVRAGR
jgi:phosphoketolase